MNARIDTLAPVSRPAELPNAYCPRDGLLREAWEHVTFVAYYNVIAIATDDLDAPDFYAPRGPRWPWRKVAGLLGLAR